jgi:hypothetical protein
MYNFNEYIARRAPRRARLAAGPQEGERAGVPRRKGRRDKSTTGKIGPHIKESLQKYFFVFSWQNYEEVGILSRITFFASSYASCSSSDARVLFLFCFLKSITEVLLQAFVLDLVSLFIQNGCH